jgi:hypothetical protein
MHKSVPAITFAAKFSTSEGKTGSLTSSGAFLRCHASGDINAVWKRALSGGITDKCKRKQKSNRLRMRIALKFG